MSLRLRATLDQDTVARLVDQVRGDLEDQLRENAYEIERALVREAQKIVEDELINPGKVGRVKPSTLLPLRDSYHAESFREGSGRWRTVLEPHRNADRGKVGAIENGRREDYRVVPVRAKKLSGWEYNGKQVYADVTFPKSNRPYQVMRRARDRVYQRIRRDTEIYRP